MLTVSKHNGFVVISVLLITTMSTMLAVSAIAENRLQERISGNQNKEENARANAELGVFNSYQYIQALQQQQLAEESFLTVSEVIAGFQSKSLDEEYALQVEAGNSTDSIILTSTGTYQNANASLKAHLLLSNSNTISPGIIACNQLMLGESGLIDSFDSREGGYSSEEANSNANIVALDGNLTVSGNAKLMGDLSINGSVTQADNSSPTFGGNIAAAGDVDAEVGIALNQATVIGDISSSKNITLEGVTVGDASADEPVNISTQGTLELVEYANKTVSSEGVGTATIEALGEIIKLDGINFAQFADVANVSEEGGAAPVMASNQCNELTIQNAFTDISNEGVVNTDLNSPPTGNVSLTFSGDDSGVATGFEVAAGEQEKVIAPLTGQTSTLWDGEKAVYLFEDMNLYNTMVTISGDVTIMITGDLTTSGGGSGFQFAAGDTDSSLTLLVEGQVNIGSSSSIFEYASVDETSNKVPLTIYSSFESEGANADENAVYIAGSGGTYGTGGMYAAVYAPLGNVALAEAGSMKGSIEGLNINISADAKVHYDEALTEISQLGYEPADSNVIFSSLYYYYP